MNSQSKDPVPKKPRLIRVASYEPKSWKGYYNKRILPHVTFFRVHFFAFVCMILVGGVAIWGIEHFNPSGTLSFIDALFTSASAVCVTGMGAFDFTKLLWYSQALHLVLMQLGSTVFVSTVVVMLRRRYLEKNILNRQDIIESGTPLQFKNYQMEHKALTRLVLLVVLYTFLVLGIGFAVLALYANTTYVKEVLDSQGVDATWWALFCVMCSFNQAGFNLISDGLVPFNSDFVVVFILCSCMALGNTLYPVAMRVLIWFFRKHSKHPAPYKFLLIYARECSTQLFPSIQTKVLFNSWILLLSVQLATFGALNSTKPFMAEHSWWGKLVLSFLQAINCRNTGFYMFDISQSHPATQWLYVVFMIISAYPFITTLHNSTVIQKEEQMEGVYEADVEASIVQRTVEGVRLVSSQLSNLKRMMLQATGIHLKGVFVSDSFWLVVAVSLICIFDAEPLSMDKHFTVFKVVFEVASAFGNVGLTLGYPNAAGGFAQVLSGASKVVIIGVLLLGRHRGMPDTLDAAIVLAPIPKDKETPPDTDEEEGQSSSSSSNLSVAMKTV